MLSIQNHPAPSKLVREQYPGWLYKQKVLAETVVGAFAVFYRNSDTTRRAEEKATVS